MRLYVKKSFQVLLAIFLIFVIYLNFNVTNLGTDSRHNSGVLPWGDDFNEKKSLSMVFLSKKFQEHNFPHLKNVKNTSKLVASTTESVSLRDLVYPSLQHYSDDRIQKQLTFKLDAAPHKDDLKEAAPPVVKTILVYSGTASWHIPRGSELFQEQNCAVQACELVDDRLKLNEADVVLFQHPPHARNLEKTRNQIWALFMLESPYHTPSFTNSRSAFNWTATYRHDSTIVAPYEKYIPLNASVLSRPPVRNYAEGKTKKVAWFVSNCGARNRRRQYALDLGQHIEVDIYGGCGTLKCPRFQSEKCFGMLNTDYKFYLAFENSNCRDYITEKFFINGLKHDVIPIVMGAAPEDYTRAAPPHSFIHVDDFASPAELAAYLHRLDQNDELYNEYFAWKGLWDNINTFFWCRMCAMAHGVSHRGHSWFEDVETWWRGPGVCIGQDSWRKVPPSRTLIADLAVRQHRP